MVRSYIPTLKRFILTFALISAFLGIVCLQGCIQLSFGSTKVSHQITYLDTVYKDGYHLTFIDTKSILKESIKHEMKETFYKVYPELCRDFNMKSTNDVTFVLDTAYNGISISYGSDIAAITFGSVVYYNPKWFAIYPNDIDVVTHEIMHVVQAYPQNAGPVWLSEGIADYVRYVYGVKNNMANWSLPVFNSTQHYTNSYRVTARFLVWLEKNKKKGIVQKLDYALRTHSYNSKIWKKITRHSIDHLWKEYARHPEI